MERRLNQEMVYTTALHVERNLRSVDLLFVSCRKLHPKIKLYNHSDSSLEPFIFKSFYTLLCALKTADIKADNASQDV
jgi:hypothetical protein